MDVLDTLKRGDGGDDGFSLVEILVAFVIFVVVASGALYGITTALHASRSNEARVVAANLAERQIETLRGTDANDIKDHDSQQVDVDGDVYQVEYWGELDSATGTGSACDGASGPASFKRVTVEVTWPGMGEVQPVRSDTVISLPITGLTAVEGIVTVAVKDSDNVASAGVPVILMSGSTQVATGVTRSDGCVVFQEITPGNNYYAVLDKTGYVDKNGNQKASSSAITVLGGYVTKYPGFLYDAASTVVVTLPNPTGLPVPVGGFPITSASSSFPGASFTAEKCGTAPCWTGSDAGPYTWSGLFPAGNGYTVNVGRCPTSGTAVDDPTPGGANSVVLPPLGGIRVLTVKGVGNGAGQGNDDGKTNNGGNKEQYVSSPVVAVNAGCPSESYAFPAQTAASANGYAALALPAGRWLIGDRIDTALDPTLGVTLTVTAGNTVSIKVKLP